MTVASAVTKVIYTGNGSNRVWPFTFPVLDVSHIQLWVSEDGTSEPVRVTSGYTVDMNDKTVTYPQTVDDPALQQSALKNGTSLTIMRVVPFLQELDLANQGSFLAEDIEGNFDKVVMMIQQLYESVGRALLAPVNIEDPDVAYAWLVSLQADMEQILAQAKSSVTRAEEIIASSPLPIGRFFVDLDGCLKLSIFIAATNDDIYINTDGDIILKTGSA